MEREKETMVKVPGNTTIIADKKNKSVEVWAIYGSKILTRDIDEAINFAFGDDERMNCVTG